MMDKHNPKIDNYSTNLEGQVKDILVLPILPGTGPMSVTSAFLCERASMTRPTCSSFT